MPMGEGSYKTTRQILMAATLTRAAAPVRYDNDRKDLSGRSHGALAPCRNDNGTRSRGRTSDSTLHVIHAATSRVPSIAKVVATVRSTRSGKGLVGHEPGAVADVASKDALTGSRSGSRSRWGGHEIGLIGQSAATGHDNGRGHVGAAHGTFKGRCGTAALEDVIAVVVAPIHTAGSDHGLVLDQSGAVLGVSSHGTLARGRSGTRCRRRRRGGRQGRRVRETTSRRDGNGGRLGGTVHRATKVANGATSGVLAVAVVVTRVGPARGHGRLVLHQSRTISRVSSQDALLRLRRRRSQEDGRYEQSRKEGGEGGQTRHGGSQSLGMRKYELLVRVSPTLQHIQQCVRKSRWLRERLSTSEVSCIHVVAKEIERILRKK
jgi:hypothetical protein